MQATDINRQGIVGSVRYIDEWGDVDYIENNVDLCDRAGCRCDGTRVVCANDDYHNVFFAQEIHDAYARHCSRNSDCQPMPDEVVQGQDHVQIGSIDRRKTKQCRQ